MGPLENAFGNSGKTGGQGRASKTVRPPSVITTLFWGWISGRASEKSCVSDAKNKSHIFWNWFTLNFLMEGRSIPQRSAKCARRARAIA